MHLRDAFISGAGAIAGVPRALVLVHDLFDEIEAFYTIYRLREMGMDVRVASTELREFRGKNWAATLRPDLTVREALSERWDVVAIPGGYAPDRLRRYDEVKELARRAVEQGGVLVSICHAAWVVISAGLARGRRLTGSRGVWDDIRNAGGVVVDEPYVEDGNVISTRSYSDFPEFWPRLEAKLRGTGMLPGRHPMGPADPREGPERGGSGDLTE
jgi:protease I